MARTNKEVPPRLVADLKPGQLEAFKTLCEAMFPGADASQSHVLRVLVKEACAKHKVKWPE
jgi:hypothetical protein